MESSTTCPECPAELSPIDILISTARRKHWLERTARMAINERFYDDSAFLPIGTPMPPPATTGVLLFQLKLSNADRATQSAGIAEWLRDHTPSAGLVRSLRRSGFGDLLDEGNDPQP